MWDDGWKDPEPSGEPEEWQTGATWSPEETADGAESWRGDVHGTDEAWRGEENLRDWPTWTAGPEYDMWKRRADREDPGT